MTSGVPVSFAAIVVDIAGFLKFVMLVGAASVVFTTGGIEVDMETRVRVAFDS